MGIAIAFAIIFGVATLVLGLVLLTLTDAGKDYYNNAKMYTYDDKDVSIRLLKFDPSNQYHVGDILYATQELTKKQGFTWSTMSISETKGESVLYKIMNQSAGWTESRILQVTRSMPELSQREQFNMESYNYNLDVYKLVGTKICTTDVKTGHEKCIPYIK